MSRLLQGPDERRELTAAERLRQVEGKLAISALSVSLRSSCSRASGMKRSSGLELSWKTENELLTSIMKLHLLERVCVKTSERASTPRCR